MKPYQKSRLLLLEELEEIISEEVKKRHAARFDNKDDKRTYRKMKIIGKELDTWIKELKEFEKSKRIQEAQNRMIRSTE